MFRSTATPIRGALAGVVGAATLALFFLIVDAARGAVLQTPAFLAGTLFGASGASGMLIVSYTIVHFALFVVIGVIVAEVLQRAALRPHFLFGAVLGFLLFDVLFYASIGVTGINVVTALGWPEVLAGNLVAGLMMLGVLQLTAPAGTPAWRESFRMSRIVREGAVGGIAGATIVAAWFLVFDALNGRAFFTPAAIAATLLEGARGVTPIEPTVALVIATTLLHYTAFIAVGLLAALLVSRAEEHVHVLLGAALLFVTMEVFAIGLVSIAAGWMLTEIPWWSIAVANVLAAVVMGTYLWREHPTLHEVLAGNLEEPAVVSG